MNNKNKYSDKLKAQIIEEYQKGESKTSLAKKYNIAYSIINTWISCFKNPNNIPLRSTPDLKERVEGIMIKKENGKIVSQTKKISHISPFPYIIDTEVSCSSSIPTQKDIEPLPNSDISEIDKAIKEILKRNNITQLYEQLKKCKTKKQLNNLKQFILTHSPNMNYKNMIEQAPNLSLSILIKKIILFYYHQKLLTFPMKKIEELEQEIISGTDPKTILNIINEEGSTMKSKIEIDSLSQKIMIDIIEIIYNKKQKHLCWEHCKNGYPNLCPKIAHSKKRDISAYPFIQSGYQIQDDQGNVLCFIVTECNNYQKENRHSKQKHL